MRIRIPTPGICPSCGTFRKTLHRDHIHPKALGGTDAAENIQLLCANCHEDKTFAEARAIANDPFVRERRDRWRSSPEGRERARQNGLGKRHTPETRIKMSEAHRGTVLSEKHRASLSAALAAHWAGLDEEQHRSKHLKIVQGKAARRDLRP